MELMKVEDRKYLELIRDYNDKINELLKTYKLSTDMEYKYVLAINKIANRELNQLTSYIITDEIITQFLDKTKFINNNILCNNEINIITPYIIIEVNKDIKDIDDEISRYIESVIDSEIYLEGKLQILVYINVVELWEYNSILELINNDYPFIEVISSMEIDTDFNLETNEFLKPDLFILNKVGTPASYVLKNFKQIVDKEISRVNKILYVKHDVQYPSSFDVIDIISLFNYYKISVAGSKTILEVHGNYMAKLYFEFSDSIKTFYEFIEDLFVSPSIILIKGLTPCVGVIKRISLKINALNTDTKDIEKIDISSDEEISEVTSELNDLFRKDYSYLKTYMFKYKGIIYRMENYKLFLNVDCYINGISNRYNTTIEYKGNICMLSDLLGSNLYSSLLKTNDKLRAFNLPNKYLVYLSRKLKLSSEELATIDINIDDVLFWSNRNNNLSSSIKALLQITNIDTLCDYNLFSVKNGFLTDNLGLRLNELRGELNE